MLYVPCTSKPQYGDAEIIPGHPLAQDFSLLMTEGSGNIVWDFISKKPYQFDGTYTPSWGPAGARFAANRQHINGPALNSILPAGTDGTISFNYKSNGSTLTYHYFFIVGDAATTFACYWWDSISAFYVQINGSYVYPVTVNNLLDARHIAITWEHNGSGVDVILYVDGAYKTSFTCTSTSLPDSSSPLNIGGRPSSDDRYAGGEIEAFYMVRRVLSAAEIARLAANPYCWLYSRSEQLIRSVWAASSSSTIEFTGDHSPGYSHAGTMTLQQNFTGAHAPVYSHAGAMVLDLNFTGSHTPGYSHAGALTGDFASLPVSISITCHAYVPDEETPPTEAEIAQLVSMDITVHQS